MTDDRTLERAARSWIEVGPTQAPDQAVEAALIRIQTTPQERDWLPWRFPTMTPVLRLALLVGAAVAVLAGLGLAAGFGRPAPAVAPPSAVPSSSASADPSPPPAAAITQVLRGDWQAEVDDVVRNVANPGEAIQLSFDWRNGSTAWIQPPRGDNVYTSTSLEAPEGELAFVSAGSLVGCASGDIGRYRWDRSADGMFLTLAVIDDACTGRAVALGRTWVHSLSAVTAGGPGVLSWDSRWLQMTLPRMRFGLSGPSGVADLQTFDEGDPRTSLIVMGSPMGFSDPCTADGGTATAIDPTTDGFVSYVDSLPGTTVTTSDATVAGLPAVHLTVEVAVDDACRIVDRPAFHSSQPTEVGTWSVVAGSTHSMWIVQDGAGTMMFWYEGDDVTPADEQAFVDSISFLDDLPTP